MKKDRDINKHGTSGSLVTTGFFLISGLIAFYDTLSYSDVDSKVFPQAAAILLIICATVSLIQGVIKPIKQEGFGKGVWWRRIALVLTMLLTCVLMPYIGFLPAASVGFMGGLIAGMHERWSPKLFFYYWGAGALVMIAFYSLFRFALHVPLP